MSYLGKISALVTVNTGDFAPKLNAAAKDVRTFAKTVESSIGSSMRGAAKSLSDIYTPLQKFERALRAATTAKLSFAGFAGAIKDVDMLQQRLTSLSGRQVDVVLKASGMKDITSFRNAIFGLKSQQFNLMMKVGGAERLEEIRRLIASGDKEFEVVAKTQQAMERVQSLRKELNSARVAAADVTVAVDTSSVDAAREKVRQATQELMTYAAKSSGGDITDPKQLREAALSQRVDAENKVSRLQAGKAKPAAVEEAKKEVAELSAVIKQLSALQKQKRQAERELASAERAASPSAGIKAIERDLKSAERSYKELLQAAQQKIVARFGVQVDLGDMESLLDGTAPEAARKLQAAFEAAGMSASDAAGRVKHVMDELGRSDLTASADRLRQMMSVAEEIGKPLGAAKDSLLKMASSIQAEFLPALVASQASVESLKAAIAKDEGESAVDRLKAAYADLKRNVDANVESIKRFDEASAKLNRIATGRELAFAAPQVSATLDRSAAISESAFKLPASAIQANPKIAEGLVKISELSTQAAAAYARLEAALSGGLPLEIGVARENLKTVLKGLADAQNAAEEEIQIHVDAADADAKLASLRVQIQSLRDAFSMSGSGLAQSFDQAKSKVSDLVSRFNSLGDSSKAKVSGQLSSLIGGMESAPGTFDADAIKRVEDLISAEERATAEAADLKTALNSIADGMSSPSAPIDKLRQTIAAAKKEAEGLTGAAKAAADRNLVKIENYIRDPKNANAAGIDRATRAAEQVRSESVQVKSREQPLPAGFFDDSLRRKAEDIIGPPAGSAANQLDRVGSTIRNLKSQLEALPEPLRAKFIPAINAADKEFIELYSRGVSVTGDEIDLAAAKAGRLGKEIGDAARQSSAFSGTFRDAFEAAQTASATAKVKLLTDMLISAGVSSGSAADAVDRLTAKLDQAKNSAGGLAANSKMVDEAFEQAVPAVAAATGKSQKTIGRDLGRVGDVARGGMDKFSLAANQAAFAIDDFMSSTGGVEFKLRAISNNVTQMAFVLGGTTGLFIGLGAVLAGQVAVGMLKYINNGRTAEDQTKALNDALARQKNLVEELVQAFRGLGDAMSRGGFSAQADQARQFGRQLDDITRKQKDVREARAADLSLDVQKERAQQIADTKKIEKSENVGEIIALQEQIRQSKNRERAAVQAAVNAPAPKMEDVTSRLLGAARAIGNAEVTQAASFAAAGGPTAVGAAVSQARQRADERLAAVAARPKDVSEARAQLKAQITELTPIAANDNDVVGRAAKEQVRILESVLRSLEAPAQKAIDSLAVEIAKSSYNASRQIASAQQDVADAIRRGVPAAGAFQAELDRLSGELDAANTSLAAAQKIDNVDEREKAVNRAKDRVAEVEKQQATVEARAREMRLSRGFGGDRTTAAISALRGNERFENERGGVTAAARRAADNELVARRRFETALDREAQARQQVAAAEEQRAAAKKTAEKAAAQEALNTAEANKWAAEGARDKADADAQAAAKASDVAASLAEFALSVESAIARIRKIGESAIQRSESGADAAQRALDEGRGSTVGRDAAEMSLIADRERVAKAQNALDRTRSEAMNRPALRVIRAEREHLESLMKDEEALRAQGVMEPQDPSVEEARENRLAELRRKEEEVMQAATAERRKELDSIAQSIAARERELERGRKRDEEGNEFNRQRGMVDEAVAAAERRRNEADRLSDINPSDENMARLKAAEDELLSARRQQQEVQDEIDARERQFNERGDIQNTRNTIAKNEEERAALIAKAATGALTPEEKERLSFLERENVTLRGNIAFERSEAAGNLSFGLRDRQAVRDAADRGRELGRTDRERFRRDMESGAGYDIRARASQIQGEIKRIEDLQAIGESTNLDDRQLMKLRGAGGVDGFIRQALANQMEQIAPMLFQFQQERETALLQGPSRAALQVSDVTTGQGAAELTRLLRGDDASKDVNLAELKKQSGLMEELVNVVKNNPLPVWED